MSAKVSSITNQAAELIRKGLNEGRWKELMPGRLRLAKELGISPATATRAIQMMVQEGVLESRGKDRCCAIPVGKKAKRSGELHLILLPRTSDDQTRYGWLSASYELRSQGMKTEICDFTLEDLKYDLSAVKRRIKHLGADGWVIQAGNKEILQWFSEQPVPAFAFGGGMLGIDIAGTGFDASEGIRELTRKLIQLGHSRIVLLARAPLIRNLETGPAGRFVEEMRAHDIATGPYNLQGLAENASPEELMNCLANLFRYTPPTALIVGHPTFYHGTKDFLLETGRKIPHDCSLACFNPIPGFERDHPAPTHLKADHMLLVDPLVRWARALELGTPHRMQTLVPVTLVEGRTIGPAPSR